MALKALPHSPTTIPSASGTRKLDWIFFFFWLKIIYDCAYNNNNNNTVVEDYLRWEWRWRRSRRRKDLVRFVMLRLSLLVICSSSPLFLPCEPLHSILFHNFISLSLSLSIIYNSKLNFLTLFVFVFSIIAFRKVNSENCYWTTIIWKCLEVAFFILFFYYNFIFLSCNHRISKFDSCLIYINFSYQFG